MYYNFNIKQINIVKQKKTISLNIHRFNYLPFLLHNFTGFLTLDVIIKNIHKGALSKNKLFVFAGNVVKFEYRYKFDEINLRALKPKQNELFIYIDFGLKRILQFNSKQFYLSKDAVIETSDRVNALFYKLDTHFEDELLWSCSFNLKNLNNFTKKLKNNSLLALPSFNLTLLKFFVDDFILKKSFFSYTVFVEQLIKHASYVNFFNLYFFNLYFSSFIYGLNNNFIFKSIDIVIANFLTSSLDKTVLSMGGFLWYQSRVKGYYSFKHTYYIKTSPFILRRRLYKFYYDEQFHSKKKPVTFSKLYKKGFLTNLNFNKMLNRKQKSKARFLLSFIINLCKKKIYYVRSLNKFKLNVLRQFFFKTNLLYFLKLKIKSNYIFKLKRILRLFCKKYKQHTFNITVSSGLNKQNKIQPSVFINNLFYVDSGFLVKRIKGKSSRLLHKPFSLIKKKVFLVKKVLRKTFIKKLIEYKFKKKLFFKLKHKNNKNIVLISNKFSKRSFIKSITNLLSTTQQFQFKNWLEYRFNYEIANFFGAVPFAFTYKGFVKNRMYLFYKQNFAILCNQLEFLHLILRYFWLTSYLKRLTIKNITKLQVFKIKIDDLSSFNLKVSLNDYLIKLVKAFGYNIIIKMQNFDFMTSQVPSIIAPAAQKKMKFFWRTIKNDVVPTMVDRFMKLCQGNLTFLRFSLLFVMFYNFFLYHKRFDFKIGIPFWKNFLRLKENFNLLFIKETPISFVLSKDYYVFFYKMINKHKLVFFRLLFFLKQYLQNKQIVFFKAKALSFKRILFFLNSILFFKKNIFKFSIFFFFNFFYKITFKYNIFFAPTKTYLNYKQIYNKLFSHISPILKSKILYKKTTNVSSNFQQFFFNVRSIRNVFTYNHLLNVWSWNILNLFTIKSKKYSYINIFSYKKLINQHFMFSFIERTLFLFNLKLKQNKIHLSFEPIFNNKMQNKYFFITASQLNSNYKRYFSTVIKKSVKKSKLSKFLLKFCLVKKKFLLKKKIRNFNRHYAIFFLFNKYKKVKFFYSYYFFRKLNVLHKTYLNKKRLNSLFKYNNLFDNFAFFTKLLGFLILKFKIKNIYKKFLMNYFLTSIFKNTIVFQFKSFRLFFVSIIYILVFFLKRKTSTNLRFFVRNINFICKKLFKSNFSQTKRTINYLTFFTNKINFMFFKNIKPISGLYSKKVFYLFGKFKNTFNLRNFIIVSTNRFDVNHQKNNFVKDLFEFKIKLLSNHNDVFFYLSNLGFCYLTKISIINLFFFNNKKFNKSNFLLTKNIKNFLTRCSTLVLNNELKRLRLFMHVLNILMANFFNQNSNFNVKNIFWLFNLTRFHLTLKANRFKKKLLFKCNYPFFFKTKQKNIGIFNRCFFFKKQYKLFRFVYNYGGSRFYKRKNKSNIKLKRKLIKISNKKFGKFLKWLKLTSKFKKINLLTKKKQFKKQYNIYFFFKNSLRTAFKIKLFIKRLRKLGFKLSTFFLWSIPKKKWNWRNSRFKNSLKRVLWTKGRSYHLNKLSFIKNILYSSANPLKIRYSFHKIKSLDDKLRWFTFVNTFLNPTKQYIIKRYNVNHFFGAFFKYPKTLCLTRRKKKRIFKKQILLKLLVLNFRNKWAHRLWYLINSRNVIARGDSVFFLKYYSRKLKSKKFYFILKFLFSLTKTKGARFLLKPFSKFIKYNKYIVRFKPFSKQALLAQEKREKYFKEISRCKSTYSRLLRKLYLKRLRRRYLFFKKKQKRGVLRYNKFFLNKSMRKFWFSLNQKKVKPPFRIYYNLLPWHNNMGSEKILNFHNQLFTKYRKGIEKVNKDLYLSDPVLFKQFKNMKNSKFFKLSEEQKRKFEKFKNLKREKRFKRR